MSELSSAYSEYERISNLFRCLNKAALVARQVHLGLDPPPPEDQNAIRDKLDEALQELSQSIQVQAPAGLPEESFLEKMLQQLLDGDRETLVKGIDGIRSRLQSGLTALTADDLQILDRCIGSLDRASEILFRRVQRR